ncbi:MAG: SHOCT domain-containing protein [Chloroflexota bacterium]
MTLTTVGYNDAFPITPEGPPRRSGPDDPGITLFAAITGTITSFLVAAGESDDDASSVASRLRELDALHRDGIITTDEFAPRRSTLVRKL